MEKREAKIRRALEEDVPLILQLIKELAEYEKLSHEVIATEKTLHDALFGPQVRAEALLIDEGEGAVAFALYFHNYSTFLSKSGLYLEDLYVRPTHRGRGYGKLLLKTLAQIAVERSCGRMEWSVLDWNESAIDFYKSVGAKCMDEWRVYRLAGDTLHGFASS